MNALFKALYAATKDLHYSCNWRYLWVVPVGMIDTKEGLEPAPSPTR